MAKSCLYAVHNNNILVLELKAILEFVIYVKKNHKVRWVDIFSDIEDALSEFQFLLNDHNPLPSENNAKYFAEKIIKEIKREEWSIEMHMHKVKAHSRISGNQNVDNFTIIRDMKRPRYLPSYFKNQCLKMMQHILFLFQLL